LEAVANRESHGMVSSAQIAKLLASLSSSSSSECLSVALLIVLVVHAVCRIFFIHEEVGDFFFTNVHGASERNCLS
jgi:hypothetical protein